MNEQRAQKVTIIDLFSGPGGLGEGFSNCEDSPYEISMSVEKEENAHETLTLRSFYRKAEDKSLYKKYVSSRNKSEKRKIKEEIKKTGQWKLALDETLGAPHALGNSEIFEKWKKGETPSPDDFKKKTKEQLNIEKRIEEICEATKRNKYKTLKKCDPLIVIGGPPCQAYSTIGRGRRAGIEDHNQDHDQRFFLYKEYADVIEKARPDIFIMENVSGIGSAKLANGKRIFPEIIKRLEYLKENPKPSDRKIYHIYSLIRDKSDFVGTEENPSENDFLINAVDFGVPQARKRVILIGISAEHDKENSVSFKMNPEAAPDAPSIFETINSLPSIRSSISKKNQTSSTLLNAEEILKDSDKSWIEVRKNSIRKIRELVSGKNAVTRGVEDVIYWEKMSLKLEKARKNKPMREIDIDYVTKIRLTPEEEVKILNKKPEYKALISNTYKKIEARIKTVETKISLPKGSDFFVNSPLKKAINARGKKNFDKLEKWLSKDFRGTLNHCAKQHMPEDMTRYMFSALWTDVQKKSPPPKTEPSPSPTTKFFPKELASAHKSWFSRNFQDRFRTYPTTYRAKTITSHMHKDGHANIHYDPAQMRSLTVREAARIQTFPDDYYFEGGQSAQYLQVGNAVPPFLAKQIAEHVVKIMKDKKII